MLRGPDQRPAPQNSAEKQGRVSRGAGRLLATTAAWLLAAASTVAAPAQPLFDASAPLAVTLELSMGSLVDSVRTDEPVEGRLSYGEGTETRTLDLEITVRGHSRREYCQLPPIKLNFRRSQLEGTVFAGQNKLKLVTHCREKHANRRYLAQEYAIYRALNALTDHSFQVRMLEIRYIDTDGRWRERERRGFLIEDDGLVAERLGYTEVEQPSVPAGSLDPDAIALFGLFQFMIGNTDWSLIKGRAEEDCCHNGLLLQRPDELYVIIPYDFDQAGLIDTDYAQPAPALHLRSVRERLFRGLCTGDGRLRDAIARFNERRPQVEAAFPLSGAYQRYNRQALGYIEGFYEIINDEEERRQWIDDHCRGDPSFWDWLNPAGAAETQAELP